ncbi:MAG: sodium:calcium antiporter [Anaerolineaceae bacterium]|nr:sodium:calcium antiporter [Anaerolineaceae bacterium]
MLEMLLTQPWFLVVGGIASIALLVLSADIAVNKLTGLAGFFRLSTTFAGVTVVSLATSIPEIASHFTASFGILSGVLDYEVSSSIVLGANIGSDVVQQTLIMALVIFLAGSMQFKRYFLWKSMVPMISTSLLCLIIGLDGEYSRIDGLILFGTFILYMGYLYYDERKHYKEEDHGFTSEGEKPEGVPDNAKQAWIYALIAVLAMTVTIFSSMLTLRITEVVVGKTGVGGSLIGVVTLGVASALPELITALSGIRNGHAGISLGTLIGSNITNPLVGIGAGALVSKYWVPGPLVQWDLPWATVSGAIIWALLWFNKGRAGKKIAIYLTVMYFLYVTFRAIYFGTD